MTGDPTLVVLAAGQAKRFGGGLKPLARIGPNGEAILDMVASDAVGAGFGVIVLVVSPATGPIIRRHVETNWPSAIDVRFCVQRAAKGTVDAALAAWPQVGALTTFGVANADDLYGTEALGLLAEHLCRHDAGNGLVAFRLDRATTGTSPVTRGICEVTDAGALARIDERRDVMPRADGNFESADGRGPPNLDPNSLVSMNLWALSTRLEGELRDAMGAPGEDEVLLPEWVSSIVARVTEPITFDVIPTESRCIGVTHADDVPLVSKEVSDQIVSGLRPQTLWSGTP
ncbi:MAG: NTP transferase domain-containing protein [Acidimicrobiales bacterium]